MVSFQCHGCGDVVKKPKLDQHRTRCHSGYDCIDCSKTFHTPADYKGHTSCISEAEKYEKSLYKGPKTGVQPTKPKQAPPSTNHKHTASTQKTPAVEEPTPAAGRQSNAQWGAKSVGPSNAVAPAPTNSYGGGAGGGGYGRYGGWGQTRNKVTGANDTPLGTPPPRASPVNVPPPRTVAPSQSNGHVQTQTQKDNKRKSGAADDAVNGDANSNKKVKRPKEKETTVDPASIPLPSSPGPSADDSKKEHKKDKEVEKEEKRRRKKEKREKAQKDEEVVDVEMAAPSGDEEKKKKSKKDKKAKGKEEGVAADVLGEKNKAEKKKRKDVVEALTPQTNGVEANGKSKKRKRSDEDADADVDDSLPDEERKKKKKEKKEKEKEKEKEKRKEKTSEVAMDVDATPIESTKKDKKNKEKKHKDQVVEVAVS